MATAVATPLARGPDPTMLAVVAFPVFDAEGDWVEEVRAVHDPQAALVRAHFNLVFPAPVDRGLVLRELQSVAAGFSAFDVAITEAEVVPDVVAGGHSVFLVPNAGREEIAALHRQLYGGSMAGTRRDDIQYRPHVTVGHHSSEARCRTLARDLGRHLPLAGRVAELALLEIEGNTVSQDTVMLTRRRRTA